MPVPSLCFLPSFTGDSGYVLLDLHVFPSQEVGGQSFHIEILDQFYPFMGEGKKVDRWSRKD
jgi:hypothetical protein